MIKAVHVPDEFEEKPRVLVFVCENDAYPALDAAGIKRLKYQSVCQDHTGPLPGIHQQSLDLRCPLAWLRWNSPDRMQAG
jgi:hypothetical protein